MTINDRSHLWVVLVSFGAGLLAMVGGGTEAGAAEWKVQVVDKAPPKAFDESIRKVLGAQATQLLEEDQVRYEIWFRESVPLKRQPSGVSDGLRTLKEATLLAGVVVPRSQRDYRDDELYADTYTMRFALQPQDGNHLGSSEYPYFAVMVPVKLDSGLDAIQGYQELVDASSKETATDHPMILSLRPSDTEDGELPRIRVPAEDHKSVLVRLNGQADGATASLVFDLVVEGEAMH